jgi:hypothetical protein
VQGFGRVHEGHRHVLDASGGQGFAEAAARARIEREIRRLARPRMRRIPPRSNLQERAIHVRRRSVDVDRDLDGEAGGRRVNDVRRQRRRDQEQRDEDD